MVVESKERRTTAPAAAAAAAAAWDHRHTLFILANWALMASVFFARQIAYYNPNKLQMSQGVPVIIPDTFNNNDNNNSCYCKIPTGSWTSQAGQDYYMFHRVFFQQALCCSGTFVEFGARNGIGDSNTYRFEKDMGWTGLMFEVDPRELPNLERNRPGAHILHGPVCPSYMSNVTIAISNIGGWTGAGGSIEPMRKGETNQEVNYECFHLATELRKFNMSRVDYMTIDTEGSELDIILDFPWNDFDVRVVQIEQLVEARYPAQIGKKDRIVNHMTSAKFGYKLLGVYQVTEMDTDDLIFTRNIDQYLTMTDYLRGKSPKMQQEHKY